MNATSTSRFAALSLVALGLLGIAAAHDRAAAAKFIPVDKAWIDTCVADRKAEKLKPTALRQYCACMQAVVDNNEPFESITALERTYPPAHQNCHRKAGLK